jgi:nicotinate-nucleotide pyrophosphorylase (carboxylating)
MSLQSSAKNLLSLERTLLNFLRHLCAIATLTQLFVQRVKHTECKILDTRKTTSGWRHLEKYAVQCGGGVNHRQGLYDAIMVKDTHVDLLGGMQLTLARLPTPKKFPVIVEIRNLAELSVAISYRQQIDRILLDNICSASLRDYVQLCKVNKLITEASGNLNLTNIKPPAQGL